MTRDIIMTLQVTNTSPLSFLSYGGFMGGWAALSVANYSDQADTVR